MTRLSSLTSVAVAAGIPAEQAEELARNIATTVTAAIEDAAGACISHRMDQGWLPELDGGIGALAGELADAWAAHDAEVEAALRRLVRAVDGFVPDADTEESEAAIAARVLLGPSCVFCCAPLASAEDDLCATCAAKVPELPGGVS